MKLNKKRMLGLSLGLVLVLLVIGCFASNSVDYDETEVYNEINFIKKFYQYMKSSVINGFIHLPKYCRVKTILL